MPKKQQACVFMCAVADILQQSFVCNIFKHFWETFNNNAAYSQRNRTFIWVSLCFILSSPPSPLLP